MRGVYVPKRPCAAVTTNVPPRRTSTSVVPHSPLRHATQEDFDHPTSENETAERRYMATALEFAALTLDEGAICHKGRLKAINVRAKKRDTEQRPAKNDAALTAHDERANVAQKIAGVTWIHLT